MTSGNKSGPFSLCLCIECCEDRFWNQCASKHSNMERKRFETRRVPVPSVLLTLIAEAKNILHYGNATPRENGKRSLEYWMAQREVIVMWGATEILGCLLLVSLSQCDGFLFSKAPSALRRFEHTQAVFNKDTSFERSIFPRIFNIERVRPARSPNGFKKLLSKEINSTTSN